MLKHFLVAALRNMAANKLQTAIAVFGLSIGISAALLMALVIRNQLSFDHFIPGYERTYKAVWSSTLPGRPTFYNEMSNRRIAALLKLNAAEVESSTRLMYAGVNDYSDKSVELKRGDITAHEAIYWADPNMFDVLPLPVFAGDGKTALTRPDGIVLTRAMARKYFGRDDVVGQTILVSGHPMIVRAVIEDLPANQTELQSGIFASGLASFSAFASDRPDQPYSLTTSVHTYLRLKPGASIAAVQAKVPGLIAPMLPHFPVLGPGLAGGVPPPGVAVRQIAAPAGATVRQIAPLPGAPAATGPARQGPVDAMPLLPVDQINLFEGLHPGIRARLAVSGVVGLLILFVASVNFVNLLTARAARRALEVGVRKVSGAGRRHLIVQFLGESIVTVFLATCVAVAAAEWLLPTVNAFLESGAEFDYWRNILLLVVLLAGIVVLGIAAGAYPALVLSAFRPAQVLKGSAVHSERAGAIRTALVVLQFSVLIGLVVAAAVVYQQRVYATAQGLRANIDQMLVVRGSCAPAFRSEVRKLPGVAGASCTDAEFLTNGMMQGLTVKGERLQLDRVDIDWGIFALYGVKPLAGSLATTNPEGDYDASAPAGIVLNLSAARRLGFASPEAAVGQNMPMPGKRGQFIRIAAVVPDFAFYSVERSLEPTMYIPAALTDPFNLVSIKLKGEQIPQTLAAIDRLWTATGGVGPIRRQFVAQQMETTYLSMTREAEGFAILSGVAVFLACLGLFGLSLSAADRRTKEIGVRKAMGAENRNIALLLLWQFSKPLLWANLIAWPVAWWAMDRWLSGFAYHVPLHWWLFPAAGAATLLIALGTVAGQTWLVARQKPVLALRYE